MAGIFSPPQINMPAPAAPAPTLSDAVSADAEQQRRKYMRGAASNILTGDQYLSTGSNKGYLGAAS